MIVLRGLCVLLVCCVYFSETTSKPLEPSPADQTNRSVQFEPTGMTHRFYLVMALAAASSGKNLFKNQENLSEDSVRTAKAFMSVFVKPTEWSWVAKVMRDTFYEVTQDKRNITFSRRFELLCQNLSQQMKNKSFDSVTFEELKMKVELPKPATNYIWEVTPEQNIIRWMSEVHKYLEDPQVVKIFVTETFQLASEQESNNFRTNAAAVRAMKQLARSDTLKSTVDRVFVKTLDDYINRFIQDSVTHNTPGILSPDTFMKKVDENFLKNSVLKKEYQKLKEQLQLIEQSTDRPNKNRFS